MRHTDHASSLHRFLLTLLSAIGLLISSGCASMRAVDFQQKEPRLLPEEFFSRPVAGRGGYFDRSGRLKTRLLVATEGHWDGKVLTLDEELTYESGEKHRRKFSITKTDSNHYVVTCDEFVGPGTIEVFGNTMHWQYILKEQSQQAGGIALTFDDWMFLSSDGYIVNRAIAKEFGVEVGELILSLSHS